MSSVFMFPIANTGRLIFSGVAASRSGNFELVGSPVKKLVKSFHRQYSIYPQGSSQYRLMERKAKLFSKLASKNEISSFKHKSLVEDRLTKLEGSSGELHNKMDTVVEQTSFKSTVKVGVTVATLTSVGALGFSDLQSPKPKSIEFIKDGVKNVKVDIDKIN